MQILTKYKGGSLANAPTADALLSPKDAVVLSREFWQNITATGLDFTVTAGTAAREATYATGVWGLVTSAADAHAYSIAPVVKFQAGRKVFFEAYVAVSIITASGSSFIGLSNTSGTVPVTTGGAMNGTQDGIGFTFTTSAIAAVTGDGATVTSAAVGTAAADTFVRLGFVVDGIDKVTFYVDGVEVATATSGISTDVMYETYATKYATANKKILVDWMHLAYSR